MKKQSLFLFGWLLFAIPAAVQAQFGNVTNGGTITITTYTGTNDFAASPQCLSVIEH